LAEALIESTIWVEHAAFMTSFAWEFLGVLLAEGPVEGDIPTLVQLMKNTRWTNTKDNPLAAISG